MGLDIIEGTRLMLSFIIVPVGIYIVRLEKKLTMLEIKIDQICKTLNQEGGKEE